MIIGKIFSNQDSNQNTISYWQKEYKHFIQRLRIMKDILENERNGAFFQKFKIILTLSVK